MQIARLANVREHWLVGSIEEVCTSVRECIVKVTVQRGGGDHTMQIVQVAI